MFILDLLIFKLQYCQEGEHEKPVLNSYASMIYFKDKQYIKEEPSSPHNVECWKRDVQTSSPDQNC